MIELYLRIEHFYNHLANNSSSFCYLKRKHISSTNIIFLYPTYFIHRSMHMLNISCIWKRQPLIENHRRYLFQPCWISISVFTSPVIPKSLSNDVFEQSDNNYREHANNYLPKQLKYMLHLLYCLSVFIMYFFMYFLNYCLLRIEQRTIFFSYDLTYSCFNVFLISCLLLNFVKPNQSCRILMYLAEPVGNAVSELTMVIERV